jgi:UDP-N-acetylmuramate dehydrogenase
MKIENNFSLLPYNTFGLNVLCDYFYEYETIDELKKLIESGVSKDSEKWIHIGGGSNLLFLGNYEGTVLHSVIKGIEKKDETTENCIVRVGAGEKWDDFVQWSINNQLGGVENLSFIPGEVGASPVQNIGAYGIEAKDVIYSVETISAIDGSVRIFMNEECNFGYRNSMFKTTKDYIVTHVNYILRKMPFYQYNLEYTHLRETLSGYPEINLQNVREAIITIRKEKLPDPVEWGNAGSFFKNPIIPYAQFLEIQKKYPDIPHYKVGEDFIKIPAGWLIEKTGWKGKNLGAAGVYEKQALVLINRGGASGLDIWSLADKIKQSVEAEFNIFIEPEVTVIS